MEITCSERSNGFGNSPILLVFCLGLILAVVAPCFSQSSTNEEMPAAQKADSKKGKSKGPGSEMGQGGKDIGKGAAKGTADLGKGVAGGAGDLVTGHPVDAGASLGKGAIGFGKNVGVGAGKGTYKIGKGIGGEFKKLGKKHKQNDEKTD